MNPVIEMIDIELVGSCNYKCKMCPQTTPGREKEFKKNLPWPIFEKTISEALDYGLTTVRLHGSGEPTLYKKLPQCVEFCAAKGIKTLVTTNGLRLDKTLSDALNNAGLSQLTLSAIGYDADTYNTWMGIDKFSQVRDQLAYYRSINANCNSYHLIIDPNKTIIEKNLYIENWQSYTNADIEIWQMHNWSGNYNETTYQRKKTDQRSCGRMFQPVLTVRAGGTENNYGAVVPCCMVLGSDSSAVLGHLNKSNVYEIYNSDAYKTLRSKHANGLWNDLSFCKNCDQLYNNPEVLVYTTLKNRTYGIPKKI